MMEYIQAKAYLDKKKKRKERWLSILARIKRFFVGVSMQTPQTCTNCKYNAGLWCTAGDMLANKGINDICYEGEYWEKDTTYGN